MRERFGRMAEWVTQYTGHPVAFGVMVVIVGGWFVGAMMAGFGEQWMLAMSVFAEVSALLLLLLLQRSTNVSSESLHLKLNEALRAIEGRDAHRIDIEDQGDAARSEARQQDRRDAEGS